MTLPPLQVRWRPSPTTSPIGRSRHPDTRAVRTATWQRARTKSAGKHPILGATSPSALSKGSPFSAPLGLAASHRARRTATAALASPRNRECARGAAGSSRSKAAQKSFRLVPSQGSAGRPPARDIVLLDESNSFTCISSPAWPGSRITMFHKENIDRVCSLLQSVESIVPE
jgi:hypothetical protein